LRETIWDNIRNGQELDGVIKEVKPFGALVILDDETMGLIHTSEIEKLKTEFRPKEPPEYLTRQDIRDMFKVDMSTVHNWTKAGKIKAYQIGSRVYYRRDEVEQALQPLRV